MINAFKNLLLFAILPSGLTYLLYYFLLFPKYLQQRKFWLAAGLGLLIGGSKNGRSQNYLKTSSKTWYWV
jgi:hypothetical protein